MRYWIYNKSDNFFLYLYYKYINRLTPVHINDEVSSLSAILLNDNYYQILLSGKVIVQELSVLRPEYLLLFKAKAYLDLKEKKRMVSMLILVI